MAETLAQAVRTLREQTRMSQRDFAAAAGVGKNTITNVESGKPTTPATLRLIADAAVREAAGEHVGLDADACYNRLMVAAGYCPAAPVAAMPDPESVLTELSRDPRLAAIVASALRKYPSMTTAEQQGFIFLLERF